jgi:hypothetical protein
LWICAAIMRDMMILTHGCLAENHSPRFFSPQKYKKEKSSNRAAGGREAPCCCLVCLINIFKEFRGKITAYNQGCTGC